jgi:hypothetical protein
MLTLRNSPSIKTIDTRLFESRVSAPHQHPHLLAEFILSMTDKPHHPHDKFVKAIFPLLFPSEIEETQRAVRLKEELFIDIFYKSLTNNNPNDPQQEKLLGMLGRMMKIHPTIIVEHYSRYLKSEHIDSCVLRKQVYWYSENNEYCIHIQGLATESIDPQEVNTMSILQQEPAYQKRVKELQAEGKAEGKLETAKKLLSVKFGEVSPEIEARLRSMKADDLDDLLIRSLDWTTSKSLFDYLGISTLPN